MDKSILPGMSKKSWDLPYPGKKNKKKKKTGKRGGIGGVLDTVAERNRKLKEAMGN